MDVLSLAIMKKYVSAGSGGTAPNLTGLTNRVSQVESDVLQASNKAIQAESRAVQLESRIAQVEVTANQHNSDIGILQRDLGQVQVLSGFIGVISGASSKTSSQPTFVVDSGEAFQKWQQNITSGGEDYTHVHVNMGEYTNLTGLAINLSSTKTKRVTADEGATITLKGAGNVNFSVVTSNGSDDVVVDGLTVKLAIHVRVGERTAAGFQNIKNLYRCKVIGTPNGEDTANATFVGFNSCQNLYDCKSLVVAGSTDNHTGTKVAAGYINCTNVVQCQSSPSLSGTGTPSGATTIGYRGCSNLMQCSCVGELSTKYETCNNIFMSDAV